MNLKIILFIVLSIFIQTELGAKEVNWWEPFTSMDIEWSRRADGSIVILDMIFHDDSKSQQNNYRTPSRTKSSYSIDEILWKDEEHRKIIQMGIEKSRLYIESHKKRYSKIIYNKGVNLYKSKQYLKAITFFTQSINLDPMHVNAYNNRGLAFKRTNEIEKAFKDFSKAISISPEFASAYYNKAEVCMNTGRLKEAKSNYKMFINHFNSKELNSEYFKRAQTRINEIQTDYSIDERGLASAIIDDSVENIKFLLDENIQLINSNKIGLTPLMVSCLCGNLEITKELLKNGANINDKTENGWTALKIAEKKGFKEIVMLLNKSYKDE